MTNRKKSLHFLTQDLSKKSLEYPQSLKRELTKEREQGMVREEWIAIGAAIKKLRYTQQPFIKLISQIVAATPQSVKSYVLCPNDTRACAMRECMLATADYLRDNTHLQGNKAFRQQAAEKLFALFAFAA